MNPSDLISEVLKMGGSLTVVEGMRLEVCLPETQYGNTLIKKLRSVREEVLCMLLLPKRETFHHWTLDRCLYRDRGLEQLGSVAMPTGAGSRSKKGLHPDWRQRHNMRYSLLTHINLCAWVH
jgi:hypothetical protein